MVINITHIVVTLNVILKPEMLKLLGSGLLYHLKAIDPLSRKLIYQYIYF